MGPDTVIQTDGLTKTYTDLFGRVRVEALTDLTIEVRRGEVFGIIGPNGSGKTTTIKILLGLLFPTKGHATVLGQPPTSVETKSRIGFLPEDSYLYGFLNAEETLDFFGRIFNLPAKVRKERADKLLKLFEIDHARKRQIQEYSKGMRRRVMFCQMLMNDPEVVILDEPTSGLDPISSRKIKDLILQLKEEGKTVFVSSHLLADMQDVCDRIAMLSAGKLCRYDTVDNLLVRQDRVTLVMDQVDPDAVKRIQEAVRNEGGHVVSCDNAKDTLESVFLRTVRESEENKKQDEPDGDRK